MVSDTFVSSLVLHEIYMWWDCWQCLSQWFVIHNSWLKPINQKEIQDSSLCIFLLYFALTYSNALHACVLNVLAYLYDLHACVHAGVLVLTKCFISLHSWFACLSQLLYISIIKFQKFLYWAVKILSTFLVLLYGKNTQSWFEFFETQSWKQNIFNAKISVRMLLLLPSI